MHQNVRITPAYAGKSRPLPPPLPPDGDHPRLCGEKMPWSFQLVPRKGSPPPMRGKVRRLHRVLAALRITPAYAGKRGRWQPKIAGIQDHPRLCGEKAFPVDVQLSSTGSPPPMRGKAIIGCFTDSQSGITPAYAGKR